MPSVPTQPDVAPVPSSSDRIRAVHKAILAEDKRLRAAHPWLRHQDAIGLTIWTGSLLAMTALAALHLGGALPWWLAIPLIALPISLLHELEHDLIHQLYFKGRTAVQSVLFTGIWLAKGSLNPWTRAALHLHHHHHSGQIGDVEERLLGLGVRPLPLRLLMALVPSVGLYQVPRIQREVPGWRLISGHPLSPSRFRQRLDLLFLLLPFVTVGLVLAGPGVPGYGLALDVLVVYVAPNMLRHFSISLLSSYSHYYGDIPPGDLLYQNQILRHWTTWPLQVFCCFFGATHVIHHYVVAQPFYLRHLVRHAAWAALEAQGTRVDDFGVVARANRWRLDRVPPPVQADDASTAWPAA